MSGFLDQSVTLRTYTTTQSTGGMDQRVLDSTSVILADIQPDTSGEAEDLRIRSGVITGKMYVPVAQDMSHRLMTVLDASGNEWEIQGPPVVAHTADVKWVTVRRQVQ